MLLFIKKSLALNHFGSKIILRRIEASNINLLSCYIGNIDTNVKRRSIVVTILVCPYEVNLRSEIISRRIEATKFHLLLKFTFMH